MSKVRANIAVSLDGYVAGPNPSEENPIGEGGSQLHEWIVDLLESEGHDVVAMSRSSGVDVIKGDGLAEALTGVEHVIDTASGPSPAEALAELVTGPESEPEAESNRSSPLSDARRPDIRGVARHGVREAAVGAPMNSGPSAGPW